MAFATTAERNAYFRAYKRNRRAEAIAMLGGVCVKCGTTENLEIDHVDPSTKLYEIRDVLWYRRDVRLAELAKCQLLCEDHHSDKTHGYDVLIEVPL